MLPIIVGCQSTQLSRRERAHLEELSPAGVILFSHNIREPAQVRDLCAALHDAACAKGERERTAILIDQEGGRVQRLSPPHWRGFPPARAFGAYWDKQGSDQRGQDQAQQACRASARLMGCELACLGITVACAPVADLPLEDADPVIRDRAFAQELEPVCRLARAQAEGLLDAGILPIVKHVPGHGRATCDSHKALPRVRTMRRDLAKSDFACFLALKDLPMMMTAHILYDDIDAHAPVTLSSKTIESVVRGDIDFKGLIVSDDLRMKALEGSMQELALKALQAGCDLPLYCGSTPRTLRALAKACAQQTSPDLNLPAKLDKALAFAHKRKKPFAPRERSEAERLLREVETQYDPRRDTQSDPTRQQQSLA